ncbi:MAG: hypothetical protein AB1916_12395 [Thermodesulfobacteriota bacterium]
MEYACENSIALHAVVFTLFLDVESMAWMTVKVAAYFTEHGMKCLDLSPLLDDIPSEKLIVSKADVHPSEYLNRYAAELIADRLIEQWGRQSGI